MPTEPRMRGTIMMDQLAQIEREHGRAVIDAALACLTPDHAVEIRGNSAMSWLSVPAVTAFKIAVADQVGQDPLDFQRAVVRRSIGDTIHKFWRILLKSLPDSAVVKRTPILYSKTFDRGTLMAESIERGKATFVLTGWPDMPDYDCVGLATGIEALLEYSGRRGPRVVWKRQVPNVRFEAFWQAA